MNKVKYNIKKTLKAIGIEPSNLSQFFFGFDRTFEENNLLADYFKETGENHVLIDIGVAFGHVSNKFLNKGWTVYGFEPDKNPEKEKAINTLRKKKFHLDRRAVSNTSKEKLKFFNSSVSAGISSIHNFHKDHKFSHEVETITLADFMEEKNICNVDFLKIDTEGNDLFVLQGYPFENYKPRIIIAEFDEQKTHAVNYSYQAIGDLLSSKEYSVYMSEWYPIKKYGTRHKFRHLKSYPCTISDPNAWGNFIAIRNDELLKFKSFISSNKISEYLKE